MSSLLIIPPDMLWPVPSGMTGTLRLVSQPVISSISGGWAAWI